MSVGLGLFIQNVFDIANASFSRLFFLRLVGYSQEKLGAFLAQAFKLVLLLPIQDRPYFSA